MQEIQHAQLFSVGHIILILLIVLLIKEFKHANKNEENKSTASSEKQIEEK
jgi:hypothetical protein